MEDAVFIISNLEEHSSSSSHVSVDEVLEDEQLKIPDEAFEGDLFLEPQMKYQADDAAVYVF